MQIPRSAPARVEFVSGESIERIVGAPRHETRHLARAVSAEEQVYVMHSRECIVQVTSRGSDLRVCPFSHGLERGIDMDVWGGWQDRAVEVWISAGSERLVPVRLAGDRPVEERWYPPNPAGVSIAGPPPTATAPAGVSDHSYEPDDEGNCWECGEHREAHMGEAG